MDLLSPFISVIAVAKLRNQLFISATLRSDSAVQCHLTAWLFCEGGGGVRFISAWLLYSFVLHSVIFHSLNLRLYVVHPGRAWSSSPACTRHSLRYLFLDATPLFTRGVTLLTSCKSRSNWNGWTTFHRTRGAAWKQTRIQRTASTQKSAATAHDRVAYKNPLCHTQTDRSVVITTTRYDTSNELQNF